MPTTNYTTLGWATHRQVGGREFDFPLFDKGDPSHFTLARTYRGPVETYAAAPLDLVDSQFNGVAIAASGLAADDILTLASTSPFFTGCAVVVSSVSGLTGVTAGTYYAIRLDSVRLKLASSIANARLGTAVNITADGTCDVTPPTAYLVGQSPKRALDGGEVEYERTFATVPSPWSEPEEYAFEFPGYLASTIGTSQSISAITLSSPNYVIAAAISGISIGDSVYISVKYTRNGYVFNTSFFTKAVAVSSGVSVTVGNVFSGTGAFSSITGTIRAGSPGRAESESLVCGSRILHEYALSSATAVNTDLPLLEKFTPMSSAGLKVDVLSSGTSTVPNSVDYTALIVGGGELVADSSLRRYLGNIYCRATRYVPAK